jgi:glycosyltransferase involved in cell wall biosynthesis
MRIAFVGTANPEINASQVRLYHLARQMVEAGHRVTLVVPNDPINTHFPAIQGVGVELRLFPNSSALAETFAKWRRVHSTTFDTVHVVGIGLRSLQPIGRPLRQPFYVQDYDEAMTQLAGLSFKTRAYYRIVEGLTRLRAHGIVVASRHLERLVRRLRPDLGKRLLYLPVGYDPSFEGASQPLSRQLNTIVGDRPVLTWVGSFYPGYGIPELLELATTLAKRGRRFLLMLVGDGPRIDAARRSVALLGLNAHVSLPGRVTLSDLQAYLRISDVFLLPFPDTPQNLYRCPTKLFQYIAYDRPIVTNRVGEVAEALGDAGFYYALRNSESMADACEDAIARSPGYRNPNLARSVHWTERARRYQQWLESLDISRPR